MANPGREVSGRGCRCHPEQYYRRQGSENFGKRTCKPNSVVCGHSSRRRVAADAHQRPTRRFRHCMEQPIKAMPCKEQLVASGRCAAPALLPARRFPPYLVLLRVGFTLPRLLPAERCALTAPFHPYPCVGGIADESPSHPRSSSRRRVSRGGIFSVALAVCAP